MQSQKSYQDLQVLEKYFKNTNFMNDDYISEKLTQA